MRKIIEYISLVRTHWKKSTFAFALSGYGVKYGHDQYEIHNLMRGFCEEAACLGDAPAGLENDATMITVILNPAANKRKAKKNYEKYCAPLLHLAGAYVTVIETTHEGHARTIPDQIDPRTTAILVAGGDGTISETVTGLMRGQSERPSVPVGVLPLGHFNTLASSLFGSRPSQVENMASATMAAVRGKTRKLNAYRVETIDGSGEEKAVYGVGWIEWGTWPWLKKRVKQLWYCGPMRDYIALMWPEESALKGTVEATVAYTVPCHGCSRCYEQRPDLCSPVLSRSAQSGRWWAAFVKKPQPPPNSIDYKKIENEECSLVKQMTIRSTDVRLASDALQTDRATHQPPSLYLNIGNESRYQGKLLWEGLKYLKNGEISFRDVIRAKQLELRPAWSDDSAQTDTQVLLIDNEEFELRPVRVTLLPNSLTVFCH